MQAGDRIIAVNDSVVAGVGLKTADVRKFLRGPEGTKVDVRVLRRGVAKPIDFRIVAKNLELRPYQRLYQPPQDP